MPMPLTRETGQTKEVVGRSSKKPGDKVESIPEKAVFIDTKNGKSYVRKSFMGKGGFARCYEVVEDKTNEIYACKVVPKALLVKQHQKDKMASEIEIHKALSHTNIVKFHHFFEDEDNVYVILELCRRRSLLELHKRRRHLTDPEARYYFSQIVKGCVYLHENSIIHRDLKLGNCFLDENLIVKIGDFGLATKLEHEGERKKTLCGTPNYIAPEVLGKKGHSYEVDVWSLGCILYTFLAGCPPFETSNVQDTYSKIRNNDYSIPSRVPRPAQLLIVKMLQKDPCDRPTMTQILSDPYFTAGLLPLFLPISSLTVAPRFAPEMCHSVPEKVSPKEQHVPPLTKPKNQALRVVDGTMTNYDDGNDADKIADPDDGFMAEIVTQLTTLLAKKPNQYSVIQQEEAEDPALTPIYWVSKWVDYSEKYGFGYQLCDGSMGVLFNDSTHLLAPENERIVTYVDEFGEDKVMTFEECEKILAKKYLLFEYYQDYMLQNLLKTGSEITPSKDPTISRLPFLRSWFRTAEAIFFHLSCGIFQVNFFEDHSKIIMCPRMSAVSFIDDKREFHTYSFEGLAKFGVSQILFERLKFARMCFKQLMGKENVPKNKAR